jgi:hypothetical protein
MIDGNPRSQRRKAVIPMSDGTGARSPSGALTPATHFFSFGSELLAEVQNTLGSSRLTALRLRVGDRVIKEIPITPMTAIATIAVVVGAIIITNLTVEVVKEPLTKSSAETSTAGETS